MQRKSLL